VVIWYSGQLYILQFTVESWYGGPLKVLQLTVLQFGIGNRLYTEDCNGNLLKSTALCFAAYSGAIWYCGPIHIMQVREAIWYGESIYILQVTVPVWYCGPLNVLQFTVLQFGIADRIIYCRLELQLFL
jgi:hypothetical protein